MARVAATYHTDPHQELDLLMLVAVALVAINHLLLSVQQQATYKDPCKVETSKVDIPKAETFKVEATKPKTNLEPKEADIAQAMEALINMEVKDQGIRNDFKNYDL